MNPRLRSGLWALASLALGELLSFGWLVWDDATRAPGALGGSAPQLLLTLVVLGSLGSTCFFVSHALTPQRVIDAGQQNRFARGAGLLGVAAVLALPSYVWCMSMPLSVVCLAVGIWQLRASLKAQPPEPVR